MPVFPYHYLKSQVISSHHLLQLTSAFLEVVQRSHYMLSLASGKFYVIHNKLSKQALELYTLLLPIHKNDSTNLFLWVLLYLYLYNIHDKLSNSSTIILLKMYFYWWTIFLTVRKIKCWKQSQLMSCPLVKSHIMIKNSKFKKSIRYDIQIVLNWEVSINPWPLVFLSSDMIIP